jgi:hypothetical protein
VSEATSCNYCSLKNIKARARRDGKQVVVRWNTVYVKPRGEVLDTSENSPHFAAWFMELTGYCACG